jgi:hypothetical protein
MRRDMDLIRDLMLALEAPPESPGGVHQLIPGEGAVAIDAYSKDEVAYHLQLIEEAGLIRTFNASFGGEVLFDRLSWAGHDFIDSVRSPEVWAKTKKGAEVAGGFTVDLLKDLAKGLIKKQIEDLTGVKL